MCADLSLPVHFHIGASLTTMTYFGTYPWESQNEDTKLAIGGTLLFIGNARVVTNIILSGLLDRHPTLKMVSVESGVGWIPFILETLDYEMSENAPKELEHMSMLPSQYFRRNLYATFWFEKTNVPALVASVGEDNILFEHGLPAPDLPLPQAARLGGPEDERAHARGATQDPGRERRRGSTGSDRPGVPAVRTVLAAPLVEVAVDSDPWMLSVLGPDLHQAEPLAFTTGGRWPPGPLPPDDEDPGPAGEWRPLVRVVAEVRGDRIYRATLTAGPGPAGAPAAEARVAVRLVDEGTVSVSAEVVGAAVCRQTFVAEAGERFLGFGERSHAVSIERGVVENYVGEGPYQPDEYQFLPGTVPPWGLRRRSDATYYPVPWVLSTRGYGLLVERDEVSYARFRIEADDRWSVEVEAGTLDYVVFAGPTPLDALARFTARTGRQAAPERWWFGPWYQSGHANHVPLEEEIRQVDVVLGAGAAVSAAETHCRYLPLGEDRGFEESERARTEMFHERGLAALTYLNPLVGTEYAEAFRAAEEQGALLRRPDGETYLFEAYAGGRQPPHADETQYDFTHAAACHAWARVAERAVAAGYDGWMEDFGEYTPLDAVASDGSTGTALHNRYPALFHAAADAAAPRARVEVGPEAGPLRGSGWIGSAASTPIVWGGDPTTSWGFDGLASRGDGGPDHGGERRGHVGERRGRVLLARSSAHARAADPLDPVRRLQPRDADQGGRHRGPGLPAPADLGPRHPAALGAVEPLAHASERLPDDGARDLPSQRSPDHVRPRARVWRHRSGGRRVPPRARSPRGARARTRSRHPPGGRTARTLAPALRRRSAASRSGGRRGARHAGGDPGLRPRRHRTPPPARRRPDVQPLRWPPARMSRFQSRPEAA